jgi:hypothetical protein
MTMANHPLDLAREVAFAMVKEARSAAAAVRLSTTNTLVARRHQMARPRKELLAPMASLLSLRWLARTVARGRLHYGEGMAKEGLLAT